MWAAIWTEGLLHRDAEIERDDQGDPRIDRGRGELPQRNEHHAPRQFGLWGHGACGNRKGRKVDAGRLPAGHGCGEAPAACPFSCTLEPSTQISADAT